MCGEGKHYAEKANQTSQIMEVFLASQFETGALRSTKPTLSLLGRVPNQEQRTKN